MRGVCWRKRGEFPRLGKEEVGNMKEKVKRLVQEMARLAMEIMDNRSNIGMNRIV